MITTTTGEFRKNMKKYLLQLPVTLLQYNKPFAVINKIGGTQAETNKVPVPYLPKNNNIIGQVVTPKKEKFELLRDTVKKMESGETKSQQDMRIYKTEVEIENDYYRGLGCKRFNTGERMIWLCPHDLEATKCDQCSYKLNKGI